MYHEFERGECTIIVADYNHSSWRFIQQAAILEKNKEYSDIGIGTKYQYNCTICYNQLPVTSFFMMSGNRYPSTALRVFTKLYSIPLHMRDRLGGGLVSATQTSISIVANFIEDILPQTSIPPHKFHFWSVSPREERMIKYAYTATVPWSTSERLYFVGAKQTDPTAWKYIVYKGNLDEFDQPSMSLEEYTQNFGNRS